MAEPWPPRGYEKEDGEDGYRDGEDIIFAEIINSMIQRFMAVENAYDVYLATTEDDPPLSMEDWLASLKGEDGEPGQPGQGAIVLDVGQDENDVPPGTPQGTIILKAPLS